MAAVRRATTARPAATIRRRAITVRLQTAATLRRRALIPRRVATQLRRVTPPRAVTPRLAALPLPTTPVEAGAARTLAAAVASTAVEADRTVAVVVDRTAAITKIESELYSKPASSHEAGFFLYAAQGRQLTGESPGANPNRHSKEKCSPSLDSISPAPKDIERKKQSALCALVQARRQFGVRDDVQARLMGGLRSLQGWTAFTRHKM